MQKAAGPWLGLLLSLGLTAGMASTPTLPTVRGRVFEDVNRDGRADAGERGLANVLVSDGLTLVRTGVDGGYELAMSPSFKSDFVFVETPAGYKAGAAGFYRRLSGSDADITVDFGLVPAPERGTRDFSFIHITDTHVGADVTSSSNLESALKDCAALRPAFIVATGDLTDNYQTEQFKGFLEGCKTIPVTVFHCVGNHDVPQYEKFCGPTYYAFDAGQVHFVILNSMAGWKSTPRHMEWLKRDLDLQPTNKAVLVFEHFPPSDAKLPNWGGNLSLMELLALYNVKAIFSGHWHSSKVFRYEDRILSVNTPPLCFGGLDVSLRGFVRVSVQGDRIVLNQRLSGCRQALTIVHPAGGAVVPDGRMLFTVNAYDVAVPSPKVVYQLDRGAWRRMSARGKWTWHATEALSAGAHELKVRARWSADAITERNVTFTTTRSPVVSPRPGLDWPMFKRDPERTSCARESVAPRCVCAGHKTWVELFFFPRRLL